MAQGMSACAMGSLGAESKPDKGLDIQEGINQDLQANKGGAVEIQALSDEASQEAARLLQQRRLQSNPIRAATRKVVQCSDTAEGRAPSKEEGGGGLPIMKMVTQKMPIITWFPNMNRKTLISDCIAGLTVGVMVIPQSMSYASIAGLPYIYGMYSACVPTLVYGFFGQSRQLAVGPVAMVSLLIEAGLQGMLPEDACPAWYAATAEAETTGAIVPAQYDFCPDEYVKLVVLTSAMVGIMQLLAAVLSLGFLVSFLGHPVTSGFTSGAAIIIGLSQVKYILGYDVPKSQSVITALSNIFQKIEETNPWTVAFGLVWLVALITNKKLSQKYRRLRMLGPLGPLLSCLIGTIIVWQTPYLRDQGVGYVGYIPDGLMPVSIQDWNFADYQRVLPTAFSATLIGYMESIAIGKNLAAKHGYEIEAGQELFALGISNLVGACFSCYPVTGSFSRSAVNNSTGALTQFSGLVTAFVMFLTLLVLTPLFYWLPKFALAAIVISSVLALIALGEARKLYRVKKQDFLLWVVAFGGTMGLGVLPGIALAVGLSLAIVIYESMRPQLTVLWRVPGTTIYRNVKQESSGAFIPNVLIVRIGCSMYFANASFIKDMLLAYVSDLDAVNPTEYMVLEMTPVVSIDSTAVLVIQDIVNDFRGRGIQLAFAMVGNRVDKTMRKAKLKNVIGEQWFFPTVNEAVSYCVRHQQVKRRMLQGGERSEKMHDVSLNAASQIATATEIGFSNDLHHTCTMVYITLAKDIPMIMSDIGVSFKKCSMMIVRAQIEPINEEGAKHTYFLQCAKSGAKLSDYQIERVREELQAALERHERSGASPINAVSSSNLPVVMPAPGSTTPKAAGGKDEQDIRIRFLEEQLQAEQAATRAVQKQLLEQGERIEQFMARFGDLAAASQKETKQNELSL
eukprot:TRINITY_DN3878_c0_g2_i1.p1 TRINITY_DN3878_c0_g2~~TRINITY_DN3878_c0_g2_i1.p1  ORF type:complete len:908 (+),score=210.11 TRINITY_DN3878_c0_g2_i1:157-2880(+)